MMAELVDVAPAENENIMISPPTLRRAVDQVFETDNLVQSILGRLPPAFRFLAATKGLRRNLLTAHDNATNTSVRYALQSIPTARVWAAEQPADFDCVDRVSRYATTDVMRDFLLQQDYPWSADLAEPLRDRELQARILALTCAFNKSSASSYVDNERIILPMDNAEAMRVIEAMIPKVPPIAAAASSSRVGPPPRRRIQYQWQHQGGEPHAPLTQQEWEANEARIMQWLTTPPFRVASGQCQTCMIPKDEDTNVARCQVCGSVRD
jgi:hypothetical protein